MTTMPVREVIKPTQKPVADYYAALAVYAKQGVKHESAIRSAFQNLLAHGATHLGWPLSDVPGRTIGPGATAYSCRSKLSRSFSSNS
jgi:hypothetical protein